MNANSIIGKLNMIQTYVHSYAPDLIAITETKIDESFHDNELLGNDYTIWRKDRNRHGGGVLIAVSNSSQLNILDGREENGESLSLHIQVHPMLKIRFVVMYRPPNEQNLDHFEMLIDDYKHENCIVVGDLNFPDIVWSTDYTGSVKPLSTRKMLHENALEIINNADFVQMIHEPTHNLGNTLDLILVNRSALDELYCDCDVLPYVSDHKMILADVHPQDFQKYIPKNTKPQKQRLNFQKADYDKIEQKFETFMNNVDDSNITSIESLWHELYTTIKDSIATIPCKLGRPKGHPWVTREIVRLVRKRDRMYKRNKRFPSIPHYDEYSILCNQIKSLVRKAKTDYQKHLCAQMEEGNTKPLYNYLTKHSGRSNNISGLKDCTPEEIPDKFADHFSSVYSNEKLQIPNFDDKNYPPMSDIVVHREGLHALIKGIDTRKAGGPDDISAMTLKMFVSNVPSFLDSIVLLINKSIELGKVPLIWKQAVVSPVFKNGDRKDVNNYRAISLTCILSKLTEHIICTNIWRFLNEHKIIVNNQHGFRSGYNTTTQLLHVVHFAAQALDKKEKYHIISFDFTKAFDKVQHNLLIHKLQKLNINENCVNWITDWLHERTSCVAVNGLVSRKFSVESGVPQGSVLGPLLFLLYINDMISRVTQSDCRLYADDTLLCVNVTKHPDTIQSDVNALLKWADAWGMHFNSKKCVHIQIGKTTPEFHLKLGPDIIPQSDTLRYLGVQIDSSLKWNTHISKIVAKANRCLGMIKRGLREAPIKSKLLALKTLVLPLLEYATQVWSPHNENLKTNIEKVQRDAVKWVYHLKKRESVSQCMIDHGLFSLSDRREELDVQFIRKVEDRQFKVRLEDYLRINTHGHNTRGNVISWQHRVNPWRHSFYNRVKDKVSAPSNN